MSMSEGHQLTRDVGPVLAMECGHTRSVGLIKLKMQDLATYLDVKNMKALMNKREESELAIEIMQLKHKCEVYRVI